MAEAPPPDTAPPPSGPPRWGDVLATGEIDLVGRLPYSSNNAFLAEVRVGATCATAVYKPGRGERPLHDFPPGLFRREVAAHLLGDALGWDLVPPTVLRHDAPLGDGSLQLFVEHDPDEHYFVQRDDPHLADQLRRVAVFDIVANSADRKGGHLVLDANRHVWGIDNGLTFHAQFKLRTVVWDFAGEPVPPALLDDLAPLAAGDVPDALAALLDPFERDALVARARAVVHAGVLPHDPSGQRWPWPPV